MIVFLAKHNTNNSEGFKAFSEKTRVVNIIGQNRESQTLWIANPSLPLKLALEPLSKGVHRFLVPVSVPSTSVHPGYHMCSQSDIIANFAPFLNSNNINTKLAALARTPIAQLTASSIATLWTVEKTAPVVQVLTQLADQNLMAVPVIDAQTGILADTISVSDFRVLVVENRVTDDPTQRAGGDVQDMIQALLLSQEMTVGEFLEFVGKKNSRGGGSGHRRVLKGVVSGNVLFGDAVEKVVESKVHRLWIVDGFGVPTGVLSLGDMIRSYKKNFEFHGQQLLIGNKEQRLVNAAKKQTDGAACSAATGADRAEHSFGGAKRGLAARVWAQPGAVRAQLAADGRRAWRLRCAAESVDRGGGAAGRRACAPSSAAHAPLLVFAASFRVRGAAHNAASAFRDSMRLMAPSKALQLPFLGFILQGFAGLFWKPWDVDRIGNITYATADEIESSGGPKILPYLQLDVIRKKTGFRNRPILIYVHGGAWCMLDKRPTLPICYHFASTENWVVLNINYRLAPTYSLIDMLVDIKRAIRWAKANPEIHGGNPDFIAISGGSAGGHLCTLVALTSDGWPQFQPGFESFDTSVQACLALYPAVGHVRANIVTTPIFMEIVVGMSEIESQSLFGMSRSNWADPSNLIRTISLDQRKNSVPPFFIVQGVSYEDHPEKISRVKIYLETEHQRNGNNATSRKDTKIRQKLSASVDADNIVPAEFVRDFVSELCRGNTVPVGYLEVPGAHHTFDITFSPKTMYALWAAGNAMDCIYESWIEAKQTAIGSNSGSSIDKQLLDGNWFASHVRLRRVKSSVVSCFPSFAKLREFSVKNCMTAAFTGTWTISGEGAWATGCTWSGGKELGSVVDYSDLCGPACLIVADCTYFVWVTNGTDNAADIGTCSFLDSSTATTPLAAANNTICGYNSPSLTTITTSTTFTTSTTANSPAITATISALPASSTSAAFRPSWKSLVVTAAFLGLFLF
ncbi:hypothetical protein HK100_003977 [Physocladia obscura]|uniref:homoserine O-acetyltransferase n=1 Tax=Physocladia obscura TaxID=109957 RepID=A0AAD5T6G7_9FUNG|nr:hypothetical protein HK100_003977 [Physocladia obscura]